MKFKSNSGLWVYTKPKYVQMRLTKKSEERKVVAINKE